MRIDVFQDTVCPWCRIGKAHMQIALDQWDGEPVEVYYHTFFLNPNIPDEGYDFAQYMNAKGGGRVPLAQWFDAPRRAGEAVGLTFNFEAIEHAPNSTLSHELIALAPDDKKEPIIDAVYAAYFEFGQNIGDIDVLVNIAEENDLDAVAVRQQLESHTKRNAVLKDAQQAQQLGITGVPFFVFNNQLGFSGAQPPQAFLQVFQQLAES